MMKQMFEKDFLGAVESKVRQDGTIVPLDPFGVLPDIKDEDIDFVANAFTTSTMRDIFKEERDHMRSVMEEAVARMKKLGYDSDKEFKISEEDLDDLMGQLYG